MSIGDLRDTLVFDGSQWDVQWIGGGYPVDRWVLYRRAIDIYWMMGLNITSFLDARKIYT